MSGKCYRCFRPLASCYCSDIEIVDAGIKFAILMHPKEAFHQKTGTGRLAHLSLADSEIIIGTDFTQNERVNALLGDPAYAPYLLYPSPSARFTDDARFRAEIGSRTLLVFLIDATWFFAKKILRESENLRSLPALSFRNSYRSRFDFKNQPDPACLSTIEAAYYLVKELRSAGIAAPADPEPLMRIFRKMVAFQLACEQERHEAEAAALYPWLFAPPT